MAVESTGSTFENGSTVADNFTITCDVPSNATGAICGAGGLDTGGGLDSTLTAVLDGDAMTRDAQDNTPYMATALFSLASPNVGDSKSLVVTFGTGGDYIWAYVAFVKGVDAADIFGAAYIEAAATGNTTTVSDAISSSVGDLCFDTYQQYAGSSSSVQGIQTLLILTTEDGYDVGGSKEIGASSVDMGWSFTGNGYHNHGLFSINQGAAADTVAEHLAFHVGRDPNPIRLM